MTRGFHVFSATGWRWLGLPASCCLVGFVANGSFGGSAAWGETYDQCLEATSQHPEAAYDEAAIWLDQGGGMPARHCLALALVAIGQFRFGAEKLKELAQTKSAMPKEARAELWAQAGEADLLGKAADDALKNFDEAAKLSPEDPGLYVDKARAHAMKQDWSGCAHLLDRALVLDQKLVEAWSLRSTARRKMGKLKDAEDDIEHALSLDDNRAESWLERGRLSAESGDKATARRAFLRVVLIDDKASVAEEARYALEAMDFNPDRIQPESAPQN
jgi:tetratricopeptide (TPR) repeat protein